LTTKNDDHPFFSQPFILFIYHGQVENRFSFGHATICWYNLANLDNIYQIM